MEKYRTDIRFYKQMNKTKKKVKAINDRIDKIIETDMPDKEKLQVIQQNQKQMTRIAAAVMKQYKQAKKEDKK